MLRLRPLFRLLRRNYRSAIEPPSIPPPKYQNQNRRVFSRFLKFGSFAALAATVVVPFAYTFDELHEKTITFRANHTPPVTDDPVLEAYYNSYRTNPKPVADGEGVMTKCFTESPILYVVGHYRSFVSKAMTGVAKLLGSYLYFRDGIELFIMENIKPPPDKLLPDMDPELRERGTLTLVLDLNETLVHYNWKPELCNDLEGCKRPGVDAFLESITHETSYELVLYTEECYGVYSLLNEMEKEQRHFTHVLTKRCTIYQDGKRYRDLSRLNRDPSKIVYVSGHALQNCLQPENCVPIKPYWTKPWNKKVVDTTLTDLLPFLKYMDANKVDDVRPILASFRDRQR